MKRNVLRILWIAGTALRSYARSSIFVFKSGASRGPCLSLLRDRVRTRFYVVDCQAGDGEDDSAVSAAGKIPQQCTHRFLVSNPVQFQGIHAFPVDRVGFGES